MLDTDIGVIIAESITIPSKGDTNYDEKDPDLFDKYIQVGNGQVSINRDYSSLLSTIYQLQENLGNNGYSYNEERNDLLKDSINDMEKIVSKEYKLKLK